MTIEAAKPLWHGAGSGCPPASTNRCDNPAAEGSVALSFAFTELGRAI